MKKIFLLLVAMVAVSGMCLAQSGSCGTNLTWTYDGAGTLTITGTGDMWDFAYSAYEPWYSFQADITSVSLPNGITRIGERAFYNCSNLATINLPSGLLTIGTGAFDHTALTAVVLPEGVTTLGMNAFNYCQSLVSVTIPTSVTNLSRQAFWNCILLADVTVHWTTNDALPTLGIDVFRNIKANAKLHVPCGTKSAYEATEPWSSFTIDDPCPSGQCGDNLYWLYNSDTHVLTITGTGAMYDWYDTPDVPWDGDREDIKSISMDNDITHIGSYAFYECNNAALKTISLPNKLTSIGFNAFRGCTSLTSITIPNSVTTIGGSAFQYCYSLASITIPSGVTVIGNYAFDECFSLASANIPDGVTLIDAGIFNGCSALTSITIPSGVTEIRQYAFHNTALTTIDIPSGVTSIGYYAFGGCSGLTDIYVPWTDLTSVTTDADAFDGVTTSAVNLHLPFAAWESYEATAPWNGFKHVPTVTAKEDPNNANTYYNTFYHSSVAYALPTGVEAYTAQRDGTDLILTKIAQAGDVLPAGAAVILKSSVQQFEMTPSEETPVTVGENDLLGKDASEAAPSNCYVLSGPNPSNPDITEVGFYQFSGTLGAHKAYLVLPGGSGAPKRLRFVFDSAMDIEQPTSDSSLKGGEKILLDGVLYIERGEHLYNAQGVRVK